VRGSETPVSRCNDDNTSGCAVGEGGNGDATESENFGDPEAIVLAAKADGAVFNLFDDRTGFTIDMRLVADQIIRNLLMDSIRANYDAILAILRHEAGLQ